MFQRTVQEERNLWSARWIEDAIESRFNLLQARIEMQLTFLIPLRTAIVQSQKQQSFDLRDEARIVLGLAS